MLSFKFNLYNIKRILPDQLWYNQTINFRSMVYWSWWINSQFP